MLARVDWSNCSMENMLPPLAMDRYDKRTPGAPMAESGLRDEVCHHGGCSGHSPVMTPRI